MLTLTIHTQNKSKLEVQLREAFMEPSVESQHWQMEIQTAGDHELEAQQHSTAWDAIIKAMEMEMETALKIPTPSRTVSVRTVSNELCLEHFF